MDERLKGDVTLAGAKAEYDEYVKQILAHKIILAHILVGTVPEYKGMKPEQVVPLIENEPGISEISVLPGETNREDMPVIAGMNTENKVPNEGTIAYDIRFYVWQPDRKNRNKIIVDVEAQKEKPGSYDIVTRGIFYNARQLSSQLDTEFEIPHYNDIKKVYSIWICMNVPKYLENTAVLYDIQPHDLVGAVEKKGRYDILAVIEINLGKEPAKDSEELRLHRLLGTLLSPGIQPEEKMEVLRKEYGIKTTDRLRKGMRQMCNLSEAIEEQGIWRGIQQGRLEEQANTERERKWRLKERANAERELAAKDTQLAEQQKQIAELKALLARKEAGAC